jgi:hypothetical protein
VRAFLFEKLRTESVLGMAMDDLHRIVLALLVRKGVSQKQYTIRRTS